jgi:hypothetical protein
MPAARGLMPQPLKQQNRQPIIDQDWLWYRWG